jgi:hypothetical protein
MLAGILLGISKKLSNLFIQTDFNMYALYILMFLVGISIGAQLWTVFETAFTTDRKYDKPFMDLQVDVAADQRYFEHNIFSHRTGF